MFGSQLLYEADPSVSAVRRVRAFMLYEDIRRLRRLQQESLLR